MHLAPLRDWPPIWHRHFALGLTLPICWYWLCCKRPYPLIGNHPVHRFRYLLLLMSLCLLLSTYQFDLCRRYVLGQTLHRLLGRSAYSRRRCVLWTSCSPLSPLCHRRHLVLLDSLSLVGPGLLRPLAQLDRLVAVVLPTISLYLRYRRD